MIETTFSVDKLVFFLMIFARVSCTIATAPIFGVSGIPVKTKVGLSLFLSIILSQITPITVLEYGNVIAFAILVVKEASVGIMIGLFANICMTIIAFAGNIIDIDIGFSMVTLFDPLNKMQTSISGNFYNYLLTLIMLCTNMHYFVISALADSFKIIKVGEVIYKSDYLYETVLTFMADYFIIGFRIVLPVFATIMLLNCILGILAKVAPQMNMFVIGMQLKVFAGFAVLIVTIAFLPAISDFIFEEMKKMVNLILKGMY